MSTRFQTSFVVARLSSQQSLSRLWFNGQCHMQYIVTCGTSCCMAGHAIKLFRETAFLQFNTCVDVSMKTLPCKCMAQKAWSFAPVAVSFCVYPTSTVPLYERPFIKAPAFRGACTLRNTSELAALVGFFRQIPQVSHVTRCICK